MSEHKTHRWLIASAIFLVAGLPAFSSGFSIYEQDAKASAMAGAFTARADNAAANWYNPAAMVKQDSSFSVGINAITIGGDTTVTLTEPWLGAPAGTKFEPEAEVATPFHLYYVQKVSDRIAWGFGINTPYGLSTSWDTQPITFSARKSELITVVLNPNASFALDEYWSFAFGFNYIYADIKNFSRDVSPAPDVQNLTGDGSAWGANFALHYADEGFAFGFSYRTGLTPKIEGELTLNGTKLSDGSTKLRLPDQAAIGFAYTKPEKWELELDISWARWSRFDELDIRLDDLPDPPDIPENWDDTFAVRLGGSYDFGQRHELRYGILRDENPIPDATLRASIPDADRWSGTLGYGYSGSKIDVDFYYMALFFDDRTVRSNPSDPSVVPGKWENFSHLLGVTFGWRFGGGS